MGETAEPAPAPTAAFLTIRELSHLVAYGVFALFASLVAAGSALSLAWLRIQYRDWALATSGFDGAGGNPWDDAPVFGVLLAVSVAGAVVAVLGVTYVLWSAQQRRGVMGRRRPLASSTP